MVDETIVMKLRSVFGVLAIGAIALTACDLVQVEQTYSNAVYVTGDSITWLCNGQIRSALPGRDVVIDNYPGATLPMGLGWLKQQGPSVAPHIVVALGTNDGVVPAPFATQIDSVMTYVNSLPPKPSWSKPYEVYWVNVSTLANPAYSAVNTAIAQAATRYGNLRVIDWKSWADANPQHLVDGVHPDATGCQVRAQMIAQAV